MLVLPERFYGRLREWDAVEHTRNVGLVPTNVAILGRNGNRLICAYVLCKASTDNEPNDVLRHSFVVQNSDNEEVRRRRFEYIRASQCALFCADCESAISGKI